MYQRLKESKVHRGRVVRINPRHFYWRDSMNKFNRFFSSSLCLYLFSVIFEPIGAAASPAPSATVEITPPSLKALGVSDHYLRFENMPKHQKFDLLLKRVIQKDPNSYKRLETLSIDQDGNIELNGRLIKYYSLTPFGYAPGEKVSYRVVLQDGKILSEGSYIPRPIHVESKQGTFSIEAELVMMNPTTSYRLSFSGLEDQETVRSLSLCKDEVLDHEYRHSPLAFFLYSPGVVGYTGGKSRLKIIRKSGDSVSYIITHTLTTTHLESSCTRRHVYTITKTMRPYKYPQSQDAFINSYRCYHGCATNISYDSNSMFPG